MHQERYFHFLYKDFACTKCFEAQKMKTINSITYVNQLIADKSLTLNVKYQASGSNFDKCDKYIIGGYQYLPKLIH